ncbi:hypothetical protein HID58_031454 [Brassica napus]|uniref:F-box domain-containing protein n=2 Tax=Brassica napus TaxID=3708 RepID=A0ABQ8BTQ0_BRANA|nr:hypothetical protein HID58_031454 [Brassica napus]CDY65394.1 BnaAnng20470D [Brassica napus]
MHNSKLDYSSLLLSDQLLLRVFSKLPISHLVSTSLVCKRWLFLHGRLVQSLKLLDWHFLESGRLFARFPALTQIDTVPSSCLRLAPNSGVLLSFKPSSFFSLPISSSTSSTHHDDLSSDRIHQGLHLIAQKYPNLRRIAVFGASEYGLATLSDTCRNEADSKDGWGVFHDFRGGVRHRANHSSSKLQEASYDGIKAIGECCQMLEDLTFHDHRMDAGWLAAALSFFCPMLQELHLERCHLRNMKSTKSLFLVCGNVRDIVLRNCWGFQDDLFALASLCRRVKLLYLEHCSLLTTGGLESVLLSWKGLQRLMVVSCSKIKDNEVTPELASLFYVLKELKWRPDTRSLLSAELEGIRMWRKGGKFFTSLKG